MSNKLSIGNKFPKFNLEASNDALITNQSFQKKITIVFIYPKNNTGGCTRECIDFSNLEKEFKAANAEIFWLSKDSITSHKKFIKKNDLKVTLISDPNLELIPAFGAWVKKSMYGKEYMGAERTTLLIDSENNITHIWRKVKVSGHATEVLQTCKTSFNKDNGVRKENLNSS